MVGTDYPFRTTLANLILRNSPPAQRAAVIGKGGEFRLLPTKKD
jgi:hypothetical protein